MTDRYCLPQSVTFSREYRLNTDFRNVLKIIRQLEDPAFPEALRWRIGAGLFYEPALSREDYEAGLRFLADFLSCGEAGAPGPKLLDWQQDANAIIAGVNQVAGQELRLLENVHWWTFLGYFHAMGQGELSTLVSIRDKLRRGKKLESWEQEYYRENKKKVDLRPAYTDAEKQEQERLNALLGN